MFSLQMMETSERLKGLKKLRNGILLPDAEADLPPAFDHCTLSTFINYYLEYSYSILPCRETLPKAQRTQGLSSAYQSNFFRSYLKFYAVVLGSQLQKKYILVYNGARF